MSHVDRLIAAARDLCALCGIDATGMTEEKAHRIYEAVKGEVTDEQLESYLIEHDLGRYGERLAERFAHVEPAPTSSRLTPWRITPCSD